MSDKRPSSTAVQGISALFAVSTYTDRSGAKRKHYHPVFRVQTRTVSGGWINRSFPILRHGIAEAWSKAVECLARARGLRRWAHLRRLQPEPAQFERLREHMRAKGHEIPEEMVPGRRPAAGAGRRERQRTARQESGLGHIRRTKNRLTLLAHLAEHGRTDPSTLGQHYFAHIYAIRPRDTDEGVRRASACHALQRMARYGLVRLLANGDAKITSAGRRFLDLEYEYE